MSDPKDDIFPTARRPTDRPELSAPPRRPEAPPRREPPPQPEPPPRREPPPQPAPPPRREPPPAPPPKREPPSPSARQRAVLEFGSFREFIDDYSPYISGAGVFLLDSAAQPGDEVAFEVRLSDDFRLIHGVGRVEWAVPRGAGGHREGAALRFIDLDEPSRRLVARLVDNHRNTGGTPFDIDELPAAARVTRAVPPPAEPVAPETPAAESTGAGGASDAPELSSGLASPAGLGLETIALPRSLAGAAAEPPAPGEDDLPPPGAPVTPPPAADVVGETGEAMDAIEARAAAERRRTEEPPLAATGDEPLAEPEPPLDLAAAAGPPGELPGVPAPALEPAAPAGAEPPQPSIPDLEAPQSAGFEPAELSEVAELPSSAEREELLPVIPPESDEPAAPPERAAAFPLEPPPPSLADEPPARPDRPAPPAAPAAPEPPAPAAAPPVVPVVPVEMPDEEDRITDYYRASGAPRRRRSTLWLTLCLLAVVLGAAAWQTRDRWWSLLPEAITGEAAPAAALPPAVPAPPVDAAAGSPAATDESEPAAVAVADEPAAGPAAPPASEEASPPAAEGEQAAGEAEPAGETAGGAAVETAMAAETGAAAGEPPPAATAPPAEPAAAAGQPAEEGGAAAQARPGRVTDLSFRSVGDVTEVEITTDAPLSPGDFAVVRVARPPARQVIKIYGPDVPYPREAVAVGGEHVRRLRTGFHRLEEGSEVHIVADLTGPGVAVLGTEIRGTSLIIRFGSR